MYLLDINIHFAWFLSLERSDFDINILTALFIRYVETYNLVVDRFFIENSPDIKLIKVQYIL